MVRVRNKSRVPPSYPRVFLPKSVEEVGKNRVVFLALAKKRKGVCKSMKTKGLQRTLWRFRLGVPFREWAGWGGPHPRVFCKCCI